MMIRIALCIALLALTASTWGHLHARTRGNALLTLLLVTVCLMLTATDALLRLL